jgi:cathepsin B
VKTTHEDIQVELMANGPMQVGFIIYYDFLSYSSGIYYATTSYVAGAHAVKLLGWNHDANGRLYWICQNQWGKTWGEQGYFKIYAGEAGIDYAANACKPSI